MIDPVKGWFEITQHDGKCVMLLTYLVENMWLSSYPSSMKIEYDQGSEIIDYEHIFQYSNEICN